MYSISKYWIGEESFFVFLCKSYSFIAKFLLQLYHSQSEIKLITFISALRIYFLNCGMMIFIGVTSNKVERSFT